MSSQRQPSWILKDPGSFASIHVKLPPKASLNCESDAVVSFSQGVKVRGVLSWGLFAGLAPAFLTRESLFTTIVENTNAEGVADVMIAPSDPGGIVLHRLSPSDGDLLLISGAYIASDTNVKVTSEVQSGLRNSLLSGTGFFLLRAKGQGIVALSAFGAVHKYTLNEGETRAVENGHLVAWSATMKYTIGLASPERSYLTRAGEGIMCFFQGPGIVFLQSHEQPDIFSLKRSRLQLGNLWTWITYIILAYLACAIFFIYLFPGEYEKLMKEFGYDEYRNYENEWGGDAVVDDNGNEGRKGWRGADLSDERNWRNGEF
jgi:uncharacterized protein (TIGR00266 family)